MPEEVNIPPSFSLNWSPTIGKLAEALAKATLEFGPVIKATENPFYKSQYADLSTLIDATRKPLAKHGLVVTQFPGEAATGRVAVITAVLHSSGEWLRSEMSMPCSKPDAQGVGSALTYGRRYAYGATLNLAGEKDDDGNAAVGSKNDEIRAELDTKIEKQGRIARFQVDELHARAKKFGKSEEEIKAFLGELGFIQFEEVTKEHFNNVLKFLSAPKPAKVKSTFPACIAHNVVNCEECQ